jgi:glucarate dehydratase
MMMRQPVVRRITLARVRIPLRQVYVSSMYIMRDVVRTVIEVETDDGCVGLGEAPGSEEVFHIAARLARGFLDQDPLERVRLQQTFAGSVFDNRSGRNGWSAYGGLELALWDWAGRHFGLPLSEIIGEPRREWIDVACPVPAVILDCVVDRRELSEWFQDRARVDDVVEYCRMQRATRGFRCFKYKSAGESPEWDVAVMRALRRGLGDDVALRWDPNAAYPVADATAICGRLDELGLEFFEDPTDDISGMASLRGRVRTPVATNMCVIQLDHLASAIRHRPADVVLADIYMWGGLENILTMHATAHAYGFGVGVHSLFETGIGTAANLHLASALDLVDHANDCGLHVLRWDIVQPGALQATDGRMRVPDGPGLGVTVDREAIDEHTIERLEVAESRFA